MVETFIRLMIFISSIVLSYLLICYIDKKSNILKKISKKYAIYFEFQILIFFFLGLLIVSMISFLLGLVIIVPQNVVSILVGIVFGVTCYWISKIDDLYK